MIEPAYQSDKVTLYLGDCLEILLQLEAENIDAVITDLPYFWIANHDWDRQWKTRRDYLDWICKLAKEWQRILKSNSSIFVFCDEKMEAYIQVELDGIFLLINKIVWFKRNNLPQINSHLLRSFAPMTERALLYSTQYDPTGWDTVKLDINNFIPLRKYFREFQKDLGMSIKQINARLRHRKAEHAFYWNSTQWDLPTPETYAELCNLPQHNGFLRREYEDLRREYEDLRRPFNADSKTWDVIEHPTISSADNTDHPTTKPIGLMSRIIAVITNKDQVVLDCCMGSGTTGVACMQLGRRFIGIEIDPTYYAIAEKRIKQAEMQLLLGI